MGLKVVEFESAGNCWQSHLRGSWASDAELGTTPHLTKVVWVVVLGIIVSNILASAKVLLLSTSSFCTQPIAHSFSGQQLKTVIVGTSERQ